MSITGVYVSDWSEIDADSVKMLWKLFLGLACKRSQRSNLADHTTATVFNPIQCSTIGPLRLIQPLSDLFK